MSPLLVPEVAEVFSAVGENMVYVFYSFFFFFKWEATFRSQHVTLTISGHFRLTK